MVRPRPRFLLALIVSLSLAAPAARADDVADEAELYFRIGAEKFMGRDFRGALEYFLRSNRLVRNRNVMFNIARSYEQIGQLTDAFRYYTMALEGETDAAARKAAEAALSALRARVAILEVDSDPPGANIYVERKDLGARGTTPRSLAFAPGTYRVLADLPGHNDAAPVEVKLELGKTARVKLSLKKILGQVAVEGAPQGATFSVDDGPPSPLSAVIGVPPGKHQLTLRLPGHQDDAHLIDVAPDAVIKIRARLVPVVGSLVVATDERDAEILVDGKQVGFTPAVVPVAVGRHTVKVRLPGFREVVREIDVSSSEPTRLEVDLRQVEEIAAASRTAESVEDAPGSVSTISGRELRAFGYPTIAEALRGQRGFYVSDNRNYASVGVRGFSFLGDYGQRLLVLLDGHPTNDNYLGSSYTGIDNRTDLDDVERIEVIRGPGSVVYGTNAFLGVVNMVPRQGRGRTGGEVGISIFDYGLARGRARADVAVGDASAWLSVMGSEGKGRSSYSFPELVSPTYDGVVRNADGVASRSAQAGVRWRSLSVQGFYTSRDKIVPTGAYDTIPADTRTRLLDTRAFVEARFEPRITESLQLLARAHANLYHFRGSYAYTSAQGGLNKEEFDGRWFGGELRALYSPSPSLRLMLGGEGQIHPTASLVGRDDNGPFLDDSHPFRVVGAYASADWAPASFFRLSAGSRLDYFSTFPQLAFSPRIAAIFHPTKTNTVKVIGAKAFRAPSLYELYYSEGDGLTQKVNPELRPETIYSGEIDVTQRLSPATTLGGAFFVSTIGGLITTQNADVGIGTILFQNSPADVLVYGAEAELRRDFREGWMAAVTGSVHKASYQQDSGDPVRFRDVPDTPRFLASLRGAIPLLNRALTLASRVSLEGPRPDRYELSTDPPQGKSDSAVIWDVIFSGEESRYGVTYSLGVYNLFDWRYRLPLSVDYRQNLMPQNGRTMLASLKVAF